MKELQIKASDYGLEEKKAKQISDMFKPMLDRMTELEVQYNEVVKRPMEPETIKMAYDLRLAYVKVRTGTAEIHKQVKAFYRQGGLFVDGWKNAQLMASQGIEEKLKAIENHFVNIEKEKVLKLQESRSVELQKYEVEFIPDQLGGMDDAVWSNYISGVKLNYDAQKEAERKVEEGRIEKEKAEAAERERIRVENEQLKKEAEAREKAEVIRINKEAKERKAREEKEAAELKAREEAAEKERKIREEKARIEREKYEADLKAEREEKERMEAELKAKADQERKAREEKEAAEQAELNKGDAAKVQDLIFDLHALKSKYSFKSAKNKKMYSDVNSLLVKVIEHINK